MKIWSWGIIGTVAVAGSDFERAKTFAKNHNIPKHYGSYAGLANDSEVDIVYVGVMNHLHEVATITAIKGGKAVLCEKPFSNNYESALRMVETARNNKIFLMEAMWTRYFPVTSGITKILDQNLIGDLHTIVCIIGCAQGDSLRMNYKEYGASSLYDMGVYAVAYASAIFGPEYPDSIQSTSRMNQVEGFDVENSIIIKYKNGGVAIIHCSIETVLNPRLEILGKRGRIECHNFWCPTEFSVIFDDASSSTFNAQTNPEYQLPVDTNSYNYNMSVGLHYEAAYVQDLLGKGRLESDKQNLDESLTIMKILQTIATQTAL